MIPANQETHFVTVKRTEAQYRELVMGTFSKDQVAIPLSLSSEVQSESVTFRIVPKNQDIETSFVIKYWHLLRPQNTLLVLVPLFSVYFLSGVQAEISILNLTLAALSLSALVLGFNLRNDVEDHVRGFDRVHTQSGPQVIQKGWFAATQLNQISWALFAFAATLGLPLLVGSQTILVLLTLLAAGIVLGFSSHQLGLRYSWFSEFVTFIISGPMLSSAVSILFLGYVSKSAFIVGTMWGTWVCLFVQFKAFRKIMILSQAGVKNWMTAVGFDKAQRLLVFLYMAGVFSILLLSLVLDAPFVWGLVLGASFLSLSWLTVKKVASVQSPLGSSIEELLRWINHHHYSLALAFLVASVLSFIFGKSGL